MGQDLLVTTTSTTAADLDRALAAAAARGLPCQIIMADGQLCMPTTRPPETFRELRLRVPAGMITPRRQPAGFSLLVFGNADAALLAAQARLADVLRGS